MGSCPRILAAAISGRHLFVSGGPLAAGLASKQTSHLLVPLLLQAFIRKYAPAVIIIGVVLLLLYLRSFFYK